MPEYIRRKFKVKTYNTNIKKIENIENKIIENIIRNDFSQTKTTGKILTGPWKGYLHSQLSGKLGYYRIIYSYEKNTLKFIIIGTKKELGIN